MEDIRIQFGDLVVSEPPLGCALELSWTVLNTCAVGAFSVVMNVGGMMGMVMEEEEDLVLDAMDSIEVNEALVVLVCCD